MKVVATHFVMSITRHSEYGQIKKVYELSAESGEYILVHEGLPFTSYEKITKERFLILKANGLESNPEAPLV
jgi:hypothetical protein